jgi:hypothetical protein
LIYGNAQALSFSNLITNSLEVNDERVSRDTNRNDCASDTRQRESESDSTTKDHKHQVGHNSGRNQADYGNDTQSSVVKEQVDGNEKQTKATSYQTCLQLITAESW